jgi:hypothetical protein
MSKGAKNIVFLKLFFAVLFLVSLFGNANECSTNSRQAHGDQASFKSKELHKGPYHGSDLPFGSKGTLPGETPLENDSEKEIDDEDDKDDKEYWHRSINESIAGISIKSSLNCCTKLFENHQSISLFILHHSWKSYLK